MLRFLFCLLFIVCCVNLFAETCLTDEEAKRITDRLDKDKQIIQWQNDRWNLLMDTAPIIKYNTIEGKGIEQTIEFNIKDDKPLIYKVLLDIDKEKRDAYFFPFTFGLCVMLEPFISNYFDAKLTLEIFSLSPLSTNYIKDLSLHLLIGAQSTGMSISYRFAKILPNTRLHAYYGIDYVMRQPTYGIGLSLNF